MAKEKAQKQVKHFYTISKLKTPLGDHWPGYQLEQIAVLGDKVVGHSILKQKDTIQMISSMAFEHIMSDITIAEEIEFNAKLS
jgi:hypothetical protein